MKLNLLTINIRGLNDPIAVDVLQGYIRDCNPSLDIVLVQEHKLRGPPLQHIGHRLWGAATVLSADAAARYGHDPHDLGARCGGIMTPMTWVQAVGGS